MIDLIAWVIVVLVIVKVFISYFLSPYHSFRRLIDNLVEPMLSPIRRVVPPVGMFDFSPLVLLILIQIAASLITRILLMLQ